MTKLAPPFGCPLFPIWDEAGTGWSLAPWGLTTECLRSLNEIPVTHRSLTYSLWALTDCSCWLGWVPWLVRLWGIQNTRYLHLEISRFTIRVYVGPPLGRAGSPMAVGTRLFGASLATLIVLVVGFSLTGDINQLYWWLRAITDHISVHYTHTFYMYKSRFRGASGARRCRGSLVPCGSASPAFATYPARGGWKAVPAPSLRLSAATVAQRRLIFSRRRQRPTRMAAP